MARSNDLTPLLGHRSESSGYRQGVILTWDPDTAENTVRVGGSIFTNLPVLNTTEASLLSAGAVVAVITWGASFAILGRVVIPGTAEAATSIQAITNRIQAAQDTAQGSRNSTTFGDLTGASVGPAVTIRIGASGRALVFWGAEMGQTASWTTLNTPHVGVELSGANVQAATDTLAANYNFQFPASGVAGHAQMSSWITVGHFHLYTGLASGDTTFTLKYKHDTVTPAGSINFSNREIAVFAL